MWLLSTRLRCRYRARAGYGVYAIALATADMRFPRLEASMSRKRLPSLAGMYIIRAELLSRTTAEVRSKLLLLLLLLALQGMPTEVLLTASERG